MDILRLLDYIEEATSEGMKRKIIFRYTPARCEYTLVSGRWFLGHRR